MQETLRNKNVFVPSLHPQSGHAAFFSICPSKSISTFLHSDLHPGGWPVWTASIGFCWVQSMGGTGRRSEGGREKGQCMFDPLLCWGLLGFIY